MKKVVFFVILAVQLGVVLVFALFGARITYDRAIPVNWDAISACAGWAAVVVSGLAIYYAIQVPKKIAEEQNKITLFEKRSAFYFNFCRCISFCEGLDSVETYADARIMFYIMFSNETVACDMEEIGQRITPLQKRMVSDLFIGNYIFDFDVDQYLGPVVDGIIDILSEKDPKKFLKSCDQLKTDGAEAKLHLTKKLKSALKLTPQS